MPAGEWPDPYEPGPLYYPDGHGGFTTDPGGSTSGGSSGGSASEARTGAPPPTVSGATRDQRERRDDPTDKSDVAALENIEGRSEDRRRRSFTAMGATRTRAQAQPKRGSGLRL